MFKRKDCKKIEECNFDNLIRMNKQIRKVKKTILSITIIIVLVMLLSSIVSTNRITTTQMLKISLKGNYNINISEEIPVSTSIFGNGFYILKVEDIPNLEIHALVANSKNLFIEDAPDRIFKYFFEKWNDTDKYQFIVVENYEDYNHNFTTKKEWFLQYQTYIDVENYNEMLNATEAIIRLKKFMKDYSSMLVNSYIRIDNELILPHNVSLQSYDSIKESAIMQYIQIVKKKNLNFTDIPKEMIDRYWNI